RGRAPRPWIRSVRPSPSASGSPARTVYSRTTWLVGSRSSAKSLGESRLSQARNPTIHPSVTPTRRWSSCNKPSIAGGTEPTGRNATRNSVRYTPAPISRHCSRSFARKPGQVLHADEELVRCREWGSDLLEAKEQKREAEGHQEYRPRSHRSTRCSGMPEVAGLLQIQREAAGEVLPPSSAHTTRALGLRALGSDPFETPRTDLLDRITTTPGDFRCSCPTGSNGLLGTPDASRMAVTLSGRRGRCVISRWSPWRSGSHP